MYRIVPYLPVVTIRICKIIFEEKAIIVVK
jgi:hypothetical protein